MKIAQVSPALIPSLTPLVHDAKVVSAIVDVQSPHSNSGAAQLHIRSTSVALPVTAAATANYQDLIVIMKDFLAPTLSQISPKTKFAINGVLAVTASVEAWKALHSDDTDNAGKAIAVTRASARVVSTLLAGLSTDTEPNFGEAVADAAITAAAALHDKKLAAKVSVTNIPPQPTTQLTPPTSNLLGGYLIGTNLGLFALRGQDLLALSAKQGVSAERLPKAPSAASR